MLELDVVCPIYRNIDQIKSLVEHLNNQKNVEIKNMVFPLTLSNDEEDQQIINYLKDNNIQYFTETSETFSHSLTREKAIRDYCKSKLVVLVSQDVVLFDENALYNLASKVDDEYIYGFGRQICTNKSIEKYIRKKNYPEQSYTVSKEDIERMQLMAFFTSDAFSCINREKFIELDGYQGYNVMFAEDMLYSKFLLDAGYKKVYVADAVVEHSHKYTLKQLYRRYYETGKFHKKIGMFDQYKSTDSGMKLALYVLKEALKHFDIPVLFRWLPDMSARYLGMKKGRKAK